MVRNTASLQVNSRRFNQVIAGGRNVAGWPLACLVSSAVSKDGLIDGIKHVRWM